MPPQTAMPLPDGRTLELWRAPDRQQPDNLRAWDAADELALQHLADEGVAVDASGSAGEAGAAGEVERCLVVNDGCGALALGVAAAGVGPVISWGDSAAGRDALQANAALNDLEMPLWLAQSLTPPAARLVVIKVPKTLALLEWQLQTIASVCPAGTPVIGAGMTRHIHTSTVQAFETHVGPTSTTRARKKARLVLAAVGQQQAGAAVPELDVHEVHGVRLHPRPGVFGAEGLDDGTALLLDNLALRPGERDVVDLACGTGVVGLVLASRHPDVVPTFTDDSPLAVDAAEEGWASLRGADRMDEAAFHVADGLSACPDASADLVVVNPPFHRGHEVGDEVAWGFFSDARRVLRPGGRLVVVGNRHLGYHAKLGRLFGGSEVLASDPRFVVLQAVRR